MAGLLAIVLSALLPGCEEQSSEPDEEQETGEAESAMNGRYIYDSDTTPFGAALTERATFYTRTVAASQAFAQCVTNTMNERYLACGDPNTGLPKGTQISRALDMVRRFNNRIEFNADAGAPTATAAYQGYGTYDQHEINHGRQYHESYADWGWYGSAAGTGDDFQPWNWYVGTLIHEFAHTHDYKHVGGCSCSDGADGQPGCSNGTPGLADEDDPTCAWVKNGTPPPDGATFATIGEGQEEFCSYVNFGNTTSYYSRGEPSLPYILGECAGALVVQSHEACGKATASSACGENELRLLTSWTGSAGQDQTSTQCGCVEDPRHLVAFRGTTGDLLTAPSGGGSTIQTNAANTRGPWQTFFVIDLNGGRWNNWDPVHIQSFDSHWLDASFDPTLLTPGGLSFAIGSSSIGPGVGLNSGNWINIRRANPYDATIRFAQDNGTELIPGASPSGNSSYQFQIQDYRRERLVYLGTDHGRFVNVSDTSMYLFNTTTPATLASTSTSSGTTKAKRRSAFWLIDHNGAPLEDGDTVSFEVFRDEAWHYMSTRYGTGTAPMRAHHSIGAAERFVVHKIAGTPGEEVRSSDTITLRASDGLWVTAMPSGASYEMRKGGSWEGPWQEMTLTYVDQHDRARPTW